MTKPATLILITLILAFGFFLRIYRLSFLPAGFFCDEAAIGYNAYSVLKTGADEYGTRLPFFFRSFGAYRNPVPIYANIPSISVFGLNEFSVRLTTVLMGTLTILLVFLITRHLFGATPALLSALFTAISPWHIHFSRFGSEYISFPFFFCLSLYLFLLALKNRQTILPLSFFFFGITLYTYYPAWLTVPVFLAGLIAANFRTLFKKLPVFLFSSLIFTLSLLPLFIGIKQGIALTRWNQVSTFNVFSSQKQALTESVKTLFLTYINHFSYDFLFSKGDIDFPGHFITRFSVRGMGQLYLFQLPLLIFGFFLLVKNIRKFSYQILFLWFLLYPLGSTLIGTDGGGPFAFRSIIGVIPFQILSALALVSLLKFLIKKIPLKHPLLLKSALGILILFLFSFSFKNYLHLYFVEYPLYSSDFWGWQFGPREVMQYFLSVKDNYDQLYLVGEFNSPEIFIKFYDPQTLCQNRCRIGSFADFNPGKKQLFAVSVNRMREVPIDLNYKIEKTIYYPSQKTAYFILEF